MMKRLLRRFKKGVSVALIFSFVTGNFLGAGIYASAAENTVNKTASEDDSASLRLVFTTDLHGMISSMNYESGSDFKNAGLSRAYDLIKQTRAELPEENVYTFDIGDVLFDATTEYILEHDPEVVQPIYQAMAYVGYDAITLGNHDFDYGKDYLLNQLVGSGMMEKVVVSNLLNSKDNSYPFGRNMLITREARTENGNKMEVTLGIIGETIPTLSTKSQNYTGTWKTEDIVQNTEKEAAYLKSLGADIIVVLAHSGFGDEVPEEKATNAVYALTKLEDVDVILCGHEHNEFPSTDKSLYYYSRPGVDQETGKVNGKTVVMAKNLGRSIGVVDIDVSKDDENNVVINESKGEVRKITPTNTKESQEIIACFESWKEEFESYRNKELAVLKEGAVLQNYFGLLEDNETLQLQNEAKIAYTLRYIMRNKPTYSSYPIIAASAYTSYGANSTDDFVNISGTINQGDLVSIQNYRQYTSIYRITGSQLKEWLEWSASAYQTIAGGDSWEKSYASELMKKNGMSMLLSEEWLDDWSNFYMFDGIQYTINPEIAPRYDALGNKINDTRRITSLTYNGIQISDSDQFIIAAPTLSSSFAPLSWASNQLIYKQYKTQYLMSEYLEMLGKSGTLEIVTDNNWNLSLPKDYKFILKAVAESATIAKTSMWYKATLGNYAGYNYYSAVATTNNAKDATIVLSPFTTDPSKDSFDVYVEVSSPLAIKSIKYYPGVMEADDGRWFTMRNVTNKKFTAYVNGTYSIYVEDIQGNKTVRTFVIDNIGVDEMAAPKVKSVNNRSTAVKGTAEVGSKVVVETSEKTYTAQVKQDGTFSCSIGSQSYGDVIFVYVMDEENNRKSDRVKLTVRRASSNQPTVNEFYNNSGVLTGKINDEDGAIVVFADELRKGYVATEEDREILLASPEYTRTAFNILVVGGTTSEDGSFQLNLPDYEINTILTIHSMDHVGRLSRSVTMKVLDGGPKRPVVNTVYDIEKSISGNVTSSAGAYNFDVYAFVNGRLYQGQSDTSGNFTIEFDEQLYAGSTISVYARDVVDGKTRSSAISNVIIERADSLESAGTIKIGKLTANAAKVSVEYLTNRTIYISVPTENGNQIYEGKTNSSGKYVLNLSAAMLSGDYVYVYTRYPYGGVIDIASQMVPYPIPQTPKLVSEVNNTNKTVKIVSDMESKVVLTVGKTTYTSETGKYNKSLNGYVHTFAVAKAVAGTEISFYAENPSNKSDVVKSTIAKAAPDILFYDGVTAGSTEVSGAIEIFSADTTKEVTVKNTSSAVYVKVNGKSYKASISDDGTFKVKVPKLKAGDSVGIWAKNEGGTGVSVSITVQAAKTN